VVEVHPVHAHADAGTRSVGGCDLQHGAPIARPSAASTTTIVRAGVRPTAFRQTTSTSSVHPNLPLTSHRSRWGATGGASSGSTSNDGSAEAAATLSE